MADNRSDGTCFGVLPPIDFDDDEVVIPGGKPLDSTLAGKGKRQNNPKDVPFIQRPQGASQTKEESGVPEGVNNDIPKPQSTEQKTNPVKGMTEDGSNSNPSPNGRFINESSTSGQKGKKDHPNKPTTIEKTNTPQEKLSNNQNTASAKPLEPKNHDNKTPQKTSFLKTEAPPKNEDKTEQNTPGMERGLGSDCGVSSAHDSGNDIYTSIDHPSEPTMTSVPNDTREGGGGYGIPDKYEDDSDEIIPLTEDEKPPYIKTILEKKAVAVEREYGAITLQKSFLTNLQKIYLSCLVFLAALLGFYTITQTINFIVQLKDWPGLAKYPLYVSIGVFASVIIYFIYKLLSSWFALKQSPQISLDMLSTLSKRSDLQYKCKKQIEEACDDLYAILNDINKDEYNKILRSIHISEKDIIELSDSRQELRNSYEAYQGRRGLESSNEWLESFKGYQTKLDNIAEKRIKYFSYRGGITATISHIPSMDRFIVLSAMFGLVKDLLGIYNIRPSRINATILLSKVIINTFCAGYVQEGAESFSEGVKKALEAFKITFTSIPIIKDIIGTSVTLGTEAIAHAFLIHRVGVAAQKMLMPIIKNDKSIEE